MQQAIIQHGFLEESWYADLKAAWPDPPGGGFRGSHDLSSRDPAFARLPDAVQELHRMAHSREFWRRVCASFPELAGYALERFDADAHEGADGRAIPTRDVQYARLDLGWAGPGYGVENGGRGAHIDNWPRVVSVLLYFTDQSELDGGEFELLRGPGEVLDRVNVRENMAILSVQNREGWHRVNPLRAAQTWRRAAYFALSDTRDLWGRRPK